MLRRQGQVRNGWTERDAVLEMQGHEHEQVDSSDRHGPEGSTKINLLIRGFGVRVPGGAPTIKALTWHFSAGQGLFRVRRWSSVARWVLGSRWTGPVSVGRVVAGWIVLAPVAVTPGSSVRFGWWDGR
ncbi:hypothetical protein GCM10012279_02780 [Micromonospora yangpuensis]|nr:hypothetical protein GCM10012279_02780 [Micromonospora yangpuensis]